VSNKLSQKNYVKPSQSRESSQATKSSQKKYQAKTKSSQDQAKPISSQAKASQASKIFDMTKPSLSLQNWLALASPGLELVF
jgi:hypothetical protein